MVWIHRSHLEIPEYWTIGRKHEHIFHDNVWISLYSSQGDSTVEPKCEGRRYAYAPEKSAWKTPNKSGWRVWGRQSGDWVEDESLSVTCVCSYLTMTSDNPELRFNAPMVVGRYHIVAGILCNNQVNIFFYLSRVSFFRVLFWLSLQFLYISKMTLYF